MILIDTHILIWAIEDPSKISSEIHKILEENINKKAILLSVISVWEICKLVENKKIKLKYPLKKWIEKVENLDFLHFVYLDNKIAYESVNLPGKFPKDPADRFVVATARLLDIPLITSDKKILNYKHVKNANINL